MEESQKIQIRMSELRQEYRQIEGESPPEMGDEGLKRIAEIGNEMGNLETRLQAALRIEGAAADRALAEDTPVDGERPEIREFNTLYHRSSFKRYMEHIYYERQLDGAELEFSQALFGDVVPRHGWHRTIPMHMLLPQDPNMEVRVDAITTTAVGNAVVQTHPILERVFARADGLYMGARYVPVGAGQQRFFYLNSGAELSYGAESAEIDSEVGDIQKVDSDPKEGSLAYRWGITTELQWGAGQLEATLRRDAALAIASGIDETIITGRAAPAVDGLLTKVADGSDAAATVTFSDLLDTYVDRVDGQYAYSWRDTRLMVHPDVYKAIATGALTAANEALANEMLAETRFRASKRLAAPAQSTNLSQGITYAPMQDRGNLLVPTWLDVGVVFDEATYFNRRQKRLTFYVAHDIVVIQDDPWKKYSFKTA